MRNSRVQDEVDRESYPDPLSLNYNDVTLSTLPKRKALNPADLNKFWTFVLRNYEDMAEGDDVILTINNIPYLGMLRPGDEIYMPAKEDIYIIKELKKQVKE